MYDKIVLEVTKLEGGGFHVTAVGINGLGKPITEQEATTLGSRKVDTKSQVIDWFVEKVEEQ